MVWLWLHAGAEADMCETRSRTFDGYCGHNLNCASVCMEEHYTGGFCKGSLLHKECMCTKECGGGGGSDSGGSGGGGGGSDGGGGNLPPPTSGGNVPPGSGGNVPPASGDYGPPVEFAAAPSEAAVVRV